jgi:AcrR family transcriptional regulator
MATFQRARTAEQRASRAATIVDTAQSMLAEMPLADITLNGLAKRAGLAPSNVLRYFDSREAILLELVNRETEAWLVDILRHTPPPAGDPTGARCAAVAGAIATTLDAHPGFCELISVQAVVLERRVTTPTALRFKTTSTRQLEQFADWLADALPELPRAGDAGRVLRLAARMILLAGALWAQRGASEVLAEQLADLLPANATFPDAVRETLALLLLGAAS